MRTKVLLLLFIFLFLTGCAVVPNEDDISTLPAPRLYTKARLELQNHNYKNAIDMLSVLEERFPYDKHTESARLHLAFAYYKDGQPEQSLEKIQDFIERHPESKQTSYAYYVRALAAIAIGEKDLTASLSQVPREDALASTRKAFEYLAALIGTYPRSKYFEDALQRVKKLKNDMARYETYVAKYMFSEEKYAQAVNRANYVLRYYPDSASAAEARAILAMGQLRSGKAAQARQILLDLEEEFPEDPATKAARSYFEKNR